MHHPCHLWPTEAYTGLQWLAEFTKPTDFHKNCLNATYVNDYGMLSCVNALHLFIECADVATNSLITDMRN